MQWYKTLKYSSTRGIHKVLQIDMLD